MNIIDVIKKNKILIIELVIFALLLIPFCMDVLYSIPTADDFDMVNLARTMSSDNRFVNAIQCANFFYINWSGNWFIVFLQVFLSPMALYERNTFLYGTEMLVIAAAFWITVFIMFKMAFKYVFKCEKKELICGSFISAMLVVLNIANYNEIFNWYVGAEYLFELMFAFICVSFIIWTYTGEYVKKKYILLCVIGFIACMTFQMAVIPGGICLLFIVLDWIKNGKLSGKKIVPFIFMLIGGIASAAAPGNFNRAGNGDLNLGFALTGSFLDAIKVIGSLLSEPLVITLICISIIVGYLLKNNGDESVISPVIKTVISFVYTIFVLFVLSVPRVLGYNSRALPNRQLFILYIVGTIGIFATGIFFGNLLQVLLVNKLSDTKLMAIAFGITVLFFAITMVGFGHGKEVIAYRTINERVYVKALNETWNNAYRQIRDSVETDVTVWLAEGVESYDLLKVSGLSADSSDWSNGAVAEYYGKNSVSVEYW